MLKEQAYDVHLSPKNRRLWTGGGASTESTDADVVIVSI